MTKIKKGVFGGSFNPMHSGHIYVVEKVQEKFNFESIYVVPNAQNPLKSTTNTQDDKRLELVRLACAPFNFIKVLDCEIKKGGISYSIVTLNNLHLKEPDTEFYLIMGSDVFENFSKWKDFDQILSLAHLVVVNRAGHYKGDNKMLSLSSSIKPHVVAYDAKNETLNLVSGRKIFFLNLPEVPLSSTDMRAEKLLQKDHQDTQDDLSWVCSCVDILSEKKAMRTYAYDVGELNLSSPYVIISSGKNFVHVTAIAKHFVHYLKKNQNLLPQATEGLNEGRWVVLDYGVLIVHIFYDFLRPVYHLESLWKGANQVAFKK